MLRLLLLLLLLLLRLEVSPSDDDDEAALLDLLEEADGFAVGHALHGGAVDGEDFVTCD